MDFIFGIWFLVVGSLWTVGVLTLFILWLVHEESDGWAIAWMIVLCVIAYNIFQVDSMTLLVSAAAYIPIGIMWSFYRWKRFCNKKVEYFNEEKARIEEGVDQTSPHKLSMHADTVDRWRTALELDVLPGRNITRLVNWIFIWPFSVIENVLGDLYDMVVNLVKDHLISFYGRISSNALDKAQ